MYSVYAESLFVTNTKYMRYLDDFDFLLQPMAFGSLSCAWPGVGWGSGEMLKMLRDGKAGTLGTIEQLINSVSAANWQFSYASPPNLKPSVFCCVVMTPISRQITPAGANCPNANLRFHTHLASSQKLGFVCKQSAYLSSYYDRFELAKLHSH